MSLNLYLFLFSDIFYYNGTISNLQLQVIIKEVENLTNLKRIIINKGLSQSKIARLADIPQSNFNLIVMVNYTPVPHGENAFQKYLIQLKKSYFQSILRKRRINNGQKSGNKGSI